MSYIKGELKLRFAFIAVFFLLVSCGIYDYPYINPVPEGNISRDTNTRIIIRIGNDNVDNPYFTHFIIFYRIYISDAAGRTVINSSDTSAMRAINPSLENHHIRINSISGGQNVGGGAAYDLLIRTLRFSVLSLYNENIESILSDSAMGRTIEINFGHASNPRMSFLDNPGTEYVLVRPHITTIPDRYFINNPAQFLLNITDLDGDNRDVTDNAVSTKSHSYAAMYLMAAGMNTQTFVPIYSSPVFLGVLLLP